MEKVKFKLKISKLGHEKKANQILTKTIEIVKDIKELNKKDYCLFQVSQLYATFRKWRKARKEIDLINSSDTKAEALAGVFTIWAEDKYPELKAVEGKNDIADASNVDDE